MSSDQDSRGFLPPTTATNHQLHRLPPSSSTHHLPGFTSLCLPQTSPATTKTTSCVSHESELATAIDRALLKIRDAVAASTTAVTHNPVRRRKSDPTSSAYQKRPTTTARRHLLSRKVSDSISSPETETRKVCQSPRSRITVSETSNRGETPENKRLKKMEKMVTDIKQRCRDLRRESKVQEVFGEDDLSEANEEHKEVREQFVGLKRLDKCGKECFGFKRLVECDEECVGFKRLVDGALRIKMRCSCHKHFEILHNHIGCFYRLI
ncbi:hypothetical protein R6Q57_029636 [Mikania cordata]